MPLMVTDADVAFYVELTGRLRASATTLNAVVPQLAGLLTETQWTGISAAAARESAGAAARRLALTADQFSDLARRANRHAEWLGEERGHRRALEAGLLNDLGRVVRLPGDLEATAHAALAGMGRDAATVTGATQRWLRRAAPMTGWPT